MGDYDLLVAVAAFIGALISLTHILRLLEQRKIRRLAEEARESEKRAIELQLASNKMMDEILREVTKIREGRSGGGGS